MTAEDLPSGSWQQQILTSLEDFIITRPSMNTNKKGSLENKQTRMKNHRTEETRHYNNKPQIMELLT